MCFISVSTWHNSYSSSMNYYSWLIFTENLLRIPANLITAWRQTVSSQEEQFPITQVTWENNVISAFHICLPYKQFHCLHIMQNANYKLATSYVSLSGIVGFGVTWYSVIVVTVAYEIINVEFCLSSYSDQIRANRDRRNWPKWRPPFIDGLFGWFSAMRRLG